MGGAREGYIKLCYGWAGIGPMKMVYNGKTESKNPREGAGGLNKGEHQNPVEFFNNKWWRIVSRSSDLDCSLVHRRDFYY